MGARARNKLPGHRFPRAKCIAQHTQRERERERERLLRPVAGLSPFSSFKTEDLLGKIGPRNSRVKCPAPPGHSPPPLKLQEVRKRGALFRFRTSESGFLQAAFSDRRTANLSRHGLAHDLAELCEIVPIKNRERCFSLSLSLSLTLAGSRRWRHRGQRQSPSFFEMITYLEITDYRRSRVSRSSCSSSCSSSSSSSSCFFCFREIRGTPGDLIPGLIRGRSRATGPFRRE